jgi:CelD/BcsL family acetyltransferase involved in cellulose biosynthesis
MAAEARIVRDVEGLGALATAWRALPAASPTQTYDWARACAEVLVPPAGLFVVTLTGGRDVVGIAPLRRSASAPRLELLGARELSEPTDFVYADPESAAQLGRLVGRLGVPLHLARMPADSPCVAAVRAGARGRSAVVTHDGLPAPWLPLDRTWSEPESRLDRRFRENVRRRRRIAGGLGHVRFEALAPEPAALPALLAEAFDVEAKGWKGDAGTALLRDRVRGAFFRRYAELASAEGRFRIYLLRIGGRPVAMQLGVEWNERLWSFKIGYDETFARCSPGTLLMLEVLRHLALGGIRGYEFLGQPERWIEDWTSHARPCVTLRTYPLSRAGAAALATDALHAGRLAGGVARKVGARGLAAIVARSRAALRRARGRWRSPIAMSSHS